MQPHLEATKLVFIDETGATTNMTRRRGRSSPGKRCRASVSHGHWKTTTLVCGLRLDGLTAPMVMDGAAFRAYASTLLGPSLRVGDIVVLANLAAHKVQGVREALGESGATLLYLPPYSADFNPIEQAYAKLKALLRKAAAHTVDGLESAIATALEAFSPEECANYFTHVGYKTI